MTRAVPWKSLAALALGLSATAASAQLKIAYIDPLSGLMAATGDHGLRELRFAADRMNAAGGILGQKIEIVAFDGKLSPQESQLAVNRALDEGIHYVVQGNGSSVANAIIETLNRNNERNPGNRALFFNYAAIDPDFTGSKCSYWHFRFDANSDQKLHTLISYMAKHKEPVKKVYLINQDYQFGHQVSKTAQELVKELVPSARIVGDEFHALAKVKDFTPYVTKIQQSGADTVITGNWGSDLALLIKAARDAGLKARFYTFYAGVVGSPVALGEAGVNRVFNVSYVEENAMSPEGTRYVEDYKKQFGKEQDPYTFALVEMLDLLARAATQAHSVDPTRVAAAMEGMKGANFFGPIEMRKDNHQLLQNLYVAEFEKVNGKDVKYNADGTLEYGFRTVYEAPAEQTRLPTTCHMQRPTS
jgi:branched-chain amino acid transport system substrate-binding protein